MDLVQKPTLPKAVSAKTITWKCLVNDLGKPLTSFSANCQQEREVLQTRKLQGLAPYDQIHTTKCSPWLPLYTEIKCSKDFEFSAFSRVVRSIMTCSIGLRPLGHSDKICLTREGCEWCESVAVLTTDECLKPTQGTSRLRFTVLW